VTERDATPWWVDPATVPELAAVLRAGLQSRVRLFEAVCERDHRCAEVLRLGGRDLAFGYQAGLSATIRAGAPEGSSLAGAAHRQVRWGLWLDLAPDLTPMTAQCRCSNPRVPAWWLREQVSSHRRRRMLDDAARREIEEGSFARRPAER
jgi:hypothetical protein